jgi:hypothetical protein
MKTANMKTANLKIVGLLLSPIAVLLGLATAAAAFASPTQPDPAPPADAPSPAPAPAAQDPTMAVAGQAPDAQVAALAAGDNHLVTNGPVPDTAANRAKYGRPLSHAGKKTSPTGD